LLRILAGLTGRQGIAERLTGSLQLDSTRIVRELGWSPPHTVTEGLYATAQWYRQALGGAAV
jgi:nucleoside-diphosphate-sugar epimerase